MVVILKEYMLQIVFSIGILILVALIIDIISRLFNSLLGRTGRKVIIVTGAIGTPIHEIGHALMCLLFGHKIEEISLFQPGDSRGILGYVNHSYNKRNVYHVIGNFFIAIGPIIIGGAIMIGLLFLIIPAVGKDIFNVANAMSSSIDPSNGSSLLSIGQGMGDIFLSLFDLPNLANGWWWAYIILCMFIAMHMRLSTADIKSGWVGLVVVLIVFFVIDLIVGTISKSALGAMTGGIIVFGAYIMSILTISLILSMIQLVLAAIFAAVAIIIRKFQRD